MCVWTHVAKCLHMIKQLSIKIWAKNAKKIGKISKRNWEIIPSWKGGCPPSPTPSSPAVCNRK